MTLVGYRELVDAFRKAGYLIIGDLPGVPEEGADPGRQPLPAIIWPADAQQPIGKVKVGQDEGAAHWMAEPMGLEPAPPIPDDVLAIIGPVNLMPAYPPGLQPVHLVRVAMPGAPTESTTPTPPLPSPTVPGQPEAILGFLSRLERIEAALMGIEASMVTVKALVHGNASKLARITDWLRRFES